jgi:hypothetical protein
MNAKKFALVAVALATGLAAASVEARGRDDVQFSISIGSPVWSARPVPVYGPSYAPAYVPAYGAAYAPVVVAPPHYRHHAPAYRWAPTRWDRDGDGIPNRYDRVYNPRWDRDGDGIPNRYDRYDNTRHHHDGRGPGRW